MNYKQLDLKALKISKDFKRCESDLLDIIIQIDENRVFYKLGYSSLFQYVAQRLELSDAQAYSFINVARKSKEVPKIKEEIKKGNITVSQESLL